ncbi:MAG: hypothetical protein OXM55_01815 [Bdellovibrionales bacterium]|nr:hypothetical protein [Bdellovibrionales bacterium]
MGFISEELPNYLQIKDKGSPSMPDMPSIYGTFWAAIKFLIIQFEAFKENTLSALKNIKDKIKSIIKEIGDIKEKLAKVNEVLQETRSNQIKGMKGKEELKEMIVQKIQNVDLKVQSQKKISEKNVTQLSHIGEKMVKASQKNQEEISKLNALVRLQQKMLTSQEKALTSQKREVTQLKIKLKNIEEILQKNQK